MAETNGDVKKCPHCHALENEVRQWKNKARQAENKFMECSKMLRGERLERAVREAFEDYEELLNRFDTIYRDMDPGAEIRARINLLPLLAKIAETEARTEKIGAQMGLIGEQKKLAAQKVEKQELEYQEERAMIQLFLAAVEAVERLGAGQAVEADFEVIDNLKQMGVKFSPKIKRTAFLLKQTNGRGLENAE